MMAKSAAELGATDDDVERSVERAYVEWRDELVDCIKEAQRDGTIDGKAEPAGAGQHGAGVHARPEALHKGGVKPAAAQDRGRGDDRAHSHRLTPAE